MYLLKRCFLAGSMLVAGAVWAARPDTPHLGKLADPDYVAGREITVYPDGRGLPQGSGSVAAGRALYAKHCARCHGANGEGGTAPELAHADEPLTSPDASKTIGSYWPFATTLFDFVRRSMPMEAPRSLTNDEVYALTAYLLHENGLVDADAVMDRERLPQVRMPNRNGFDWIDVHR